MNYRPSAPNSWPLEYSRHLSRADIIPVPSDAMFPYPQLPGSSADNHFLNSHRLINPIFRDLDLNLSEIPSELDHLDLTNYITDKSAAMVAHDEYGDVFVGHVSSLHLRAHRIMSARAGVVKVAIKRLRVQLKKDIQLAKLLASEMAIWSKLDHANILPFLGYMFENDYPSLISEWIDYGTVRKFLKDRPEWNITRLALGIAQGLKYMHDRDIVHSGLKADNVLISKDLEPMICDIGISRMLNYPQTLFVSTGHDGLEGSTRWMAVELLYPTDAKHTKETDIWAYGMTLYEMVSRELPYAQYKKDIHVLSAVIKGERPNLSQNSPKASITPSDISEFASICYSCWSANPTQRYTLDKIIDLLLFRLNVPEAMRRILSKLSHMNLTDRIIGKSAAMNAHGGYSDIFVGHVSTIHLDLHRVESVRDCRVKVAIKRIRAQMDKDRKLAMSLAREMTIWSKLDHPNILPLLGYTFENGYPSLISEWVEHGTISAFLKDHPDCNITRLALGIARGLQYMHDQDIIHSDLKGDNVLIGRNFEPLICDFGISRVLGSSQTLFASTTQSRGPKGTIRWMAVELLCPPEGIDSKHTKETDVWAYGVTLYEIVSRELPYSQYKNDFHLLLPLTKGERPIFPQDPPSPYITTSDFSKYKSICANCWATDPTERYTMDKIVDSLLSQPEMSDSEPSLRQPDAIPPARNSKLNTGTLHQEEEPVKKKTQASKIPK